MFERILVATDFSQGAGAALDRALRMPLGSNARIDLLHVIPDLRPAVEEGEAITALLAEVDRAQAAAPTSSVRIAGNCVRGAPYVEIIRAARARDAELIVVGVHGKRRFRDLFVGSTASRIVRSGDLPVLLVRTAAVGPYRRALVAAALMDADAQLFQIARKVGIERPDVVHAVHVPFEAFQAGTAGARDTLRTDYCTAASTRLKSLLDTIAPAAQCQMTVRTGDARAVILEEARRSGAELLICGTHARVGIAHALLGSVAETMIAAAPCDVLVTRPTRFTFELP